MESCKKDDKLMNVAEKANKNHDEGPEKLQMKAVYLSCSQRQWGQQAQSKCGRQEFHKMLQDEEENAAADLIFFVKVQIQTNNAWKLEPGSRREKQHNGR